MRLLVTSLAIGAVALIGASPILTENLFPKHTDELLFATPAKAADLATPDMTTSAKSTQPGRFDDLLRVDDSTTITTAPSVSRTVLSTQTIRKVGYGQVTTVNIVTTPSGVYSSDGVASAHVLYPGVETKRDVGTSLVRLFALLGGNWAPLTLGHAGSFTYYGSGFGTHYMTDGKTTCLSGKGYYGCS